MHYRVSGDSPDRLLSPDPFVQNKPSLRVDDFVQLSGAGDELVDAFGVGGVHDEDNVLLARHLPDEVDFLPLDDAVTDGGGVDVYIYAQLYHRFDVSRRRRDGEPFDDPLVDHSLDAIADRPL